MKALRFLVPFAGCLFLCSGCLSKPPLAKETFVLTRTGKTAAPAAKNALPSLGVKSFSVAPAYENRLFLYRTTDETFEQDPYAELLVPPSRLMPHVFRAHLRATGLFKSIVEPGSSFTPALSVEIVVSEFYGDLRAPDQPAAVLSMRFLVMDSGAAPAQEPVLQAEISRRIPIRSRTAAALAAGWNQGLEEIAGEFALSLQASKLRP